MKQHYEICKDVNGNFVIIPIDQIQDRIDSYAGIRLKSIPTLVNTLEEIQDWLYECFIKKQLPIDKAEMFFHEIDYVLTEAKGGLK